MFWRKIDEKKRQKRSQCCCLQQDWQALSFLISHNTAIHCSWWEYLLPQAASVISNHNIYRERSQRLSIPPQPAYVMRDHNTAGKRSRWESLLPQSAAVTTVIQADLEHLIVKRLSNTEYWTYFFQWPKLC